MVKCDICEKEFDSIRGLNGHKRLHGESKGSYQPGSRNKKIYTFECLNCGEEKEYHPKSSYGKYCSAQCQHNHKWETVTKPKIEAGECTFNSGSILKRYLVEKHGEKCSECGIGAIWNDKPLVLQLDHVDGNSDNNFPSNLRLLCPNCHTQTETFGSKGQGNRYSKSTKRNEYLREYKGRMV